MTDKNDTVFLFDVASQEAIEATLIEGIEDKHIAFYNTKWVSFHLNVCKKLAEKDIPRNEWPQSAHWDWEIKITKTKDLLAYSSYCIEYGNSVEGMMQTVESKHSCRLKEQKGKPLIYINFLETAPWNQMSVIHSPKLRGVGQVMLRAAIQSSIDAELKGRIGLHSLPQAEEFYIKCDMADLGKDSNYHDLVYFEMNEEVAQQFIQEKSQ